MALLCVAFSRKPTDELAELYYSVLGERLTSEQWETAVKSVLSEEQFFPLPAVLLRYGVPRGVPQARAVEEYWKIVETYQGGRGLNQRQICERFGLAGRDAFLAAGGDHAFEWCEESSEPFRRKAFVEAWVEIKEQVPLAELGDGGRRQRLLEESDELL
jgi:hypothetical protein